MLNTLCSRPSFALNRLRPRPSEDYMCLCTHTFKCHYAGPVLSPSLITRTLDPWVLENNLTPKATHHVDFWYHVYAGNVDVHPHSYWRTCNHNHNDHKKKKNKNNISSMTSKWIRSSHADECSLQQCPAAQISSPTPAAAAPEQTPAGAHQDPWYQMITDDRSELDIRESTQCWVI